jgi:hypothetical protein
VPVRRQIVAATVVVTSLAHAQPNDVDLTALGVDPEGFDDKLNIYGFADFSYWMLHWEHANALLTDTSTFVSGDFALYLAKNLSRRARTLLEVRFLFAPNGSTNPDGSITNTAAQDLSEFYRAVQWGGVAIERAYFEYELDDKLTIRAGHWLTPYGIWNIDHGAPTIIGTYRPYVIGEQLFPEHQTGLDLFGHIYLDDYKLQYHATISNGRSPTEAQHDTDGSPAFGGRLELETPWHAKLGASVYGGRSESLPTVTNGPTTAFDEIAVGGDAQWDDGQLHLQAEAAMRDRHYLADKRAARGSGFVPDGRDFGMYALAGYRFDSRLNPMPYLEFEKDTPLDLTYYSNAYALHAGINLRPTASYVLKVEAIGAWFRDDGVGLLAGERAVILTSQLAWVF